MSKKRKIKANKAIWRYELFQDPNRGPVQTVYEGQKAIKQMRRNKMRVVRMTHMPTGLFAEYDNVSTLEYLYGTLINRTGQSGQKPRRNRGAAIPLPRGACYTGR